MSFSRFFLFNRFMNSAVFLICFDLFSSEIKSKTQTKLLSKSPDYINISESISSVTAQGISNA